MNLLHNSIESVEEKGQIVIYSTEDDISTKIIVEDNGCGIKKNILINYLYHFRLINRKELAWVYQLHIKL